ncbi:hypothetical protein CRUP_005359 [Coryphaenoides rupestris]|nr:hypothetical protein CRUP_005359 [Coryphaenoides rupestris]
MYGSHDNLRLKGEKEERTVRPRSGCCTRKLFTMPFCTSSSAGVTASVRGGVGQGAVVGNSFRSTVCSDPQALLSPQWKWNWQSRNWSSRGPPFSAARCQEEVGRNSFRSTVCSDPQALLSPQWKWNWQSRNWSSRGPPFSAARCQEEGFSVEAQ